jgi:NAD kinase
MERQTENKIILIRRKTRLDDLISRFNTISQAKFYIEHLGADFVDYQQEHDAYNHAVQKASDILSRFGRVQIVDRSFLPNFIFGRDDLIVAIGQDGLVANILKYLDRQLLIGVNPDPQRWDGVLLPFKVIDLAMIVPETFKGRRKVKEVTMAKTKLNDGQTLYAVNDFYIGQKTHTSARYLIHYGSRSEPQSSSGIIISTGLGSTGWLRSILTGAVAIVNTGGKHKQQLNQQSLRWDANQLYFSVREPFPSKTSQASLVFGTVSKSKPLKILSQMAENGVVFSDGIENDFLEFNSGVEATVTIAEKKGMLVV